MANQITVSLSIISILISSQFAIAQNQTPLEFAQRPDVAREINLQSQQRELIQRLGPICDAQCQARVMDMLMNTEPELQSQFLAMSENDRAQTAAGLDRTERENIETEMLGENVLSGQQMDRFLQLRTQNLGNDAFLSDRVSSLLGLSSDQITQLRSVQDAGSSLINACQSIPGLSAAEQQAGVQLIQNNLIDQSINILNGAQIEIFNNLAGSTFNFNFPGEAPSADPTVGDQAGADQAEPTVANPAAAARPEGVTAEQVAPNAASPTISIGRGSGTRSSIGSRSRIQRGAGNRSRNVGGSSRPGNRNRAGNRNRNGGNRGAGGNRAGGGNRARGGNRGGSGTRN